MKVKNLILSLITFSFLVFSCTQEEIAPQPQNSSQETMELSTMSTNTTLTTPKAYVFIEPYDKFTMVARYLKDSVSKSPLTQSPFLGFFVGPGISLQHNFLNYVNMPHWYDGRLPKVIQAEIPQTSGGIDSLGNPKIAYNFTTVKIPKNTVSGMAWINILIPVSAMSNDTKRQKTIITYEKIGNTLVTNGSIQGRSYNMNSVMYGYTFNYQGNRIPKGIYRLYTTYPESGFRANLTSTKDYYLRGSSN
jgi:hypothetical protein